MPNSLINKVQTSARRRRRRESREKTRCERKLITEKSNALQIPLYVSRMRRERACPYKNTRQYGPAHSQSSRKALFKELILAWKRPDLFDRPIWLIRKKSRRRKIEQSTHSKSTQEIDIKAKLPMKEVYELVCEWGRELSTAIKLI